MVNELGKSRREKSQRERLTELSQLPRLDLTGQNTNAPRRSPAAPPAPARDATPTVPAEVDPRITRTNQAVRGALEQALDFGNQALGDVTALATRANAGLTEGIGRGVGIVAPEAGSEILGFVNSQREFADNVALNGLFSNAAPDLTGQNIGASRRSPAAPRTPSRGTAPGVPQASGGGTAPAVPAQTQEEADVRSVLSQRLPGFSLNGQQPSNVTGVPFDTGTPVGGGTPSFVVERRGSQAPELVQLGEPQADGRRRALPTTFEFGGQTFTPAQAEALGPVIAQQLNAQGNVDAATIRSAQDAQIDARETASRQALGQALTEFDIISRDPNATEEELAAAAANVDRVRRLLITRGISDAETIEGLVAADLR